MWLEHPWDPARAWEYSRHNFALTPTHLFNPTFSLTQFIYLLRDIEVFLIGCFVISDSAILEKRKTFSHSVFFQLPLCSLNFKTKLLQSQHLLGPYSPIQHVLKMLTVEFYPVSVVSSWLASESMGNIKYDKVVVFYSSHYN